MILRPCPTDIRPVPRQCGSLLVIAALLHRSPVTRLVPVGSPPRCHASLWGTLKACGVNFNLTAHPLDL